MKAINSIVGALLLLVVSATATPSLGDCRAFCKDIRQSTLADVSVCKPALNQHPVPKLHKACVEGRKKAFDQSCLSICTDAELSVSSHDGCQFQKKHGAPSINWCRKGYDSVLANIKSIVADEKKRQQEAPSDESVQSEAIETVQQGLMEDKNELKVEEIENEGTNEQIEPVETVQQEETIESGESAEGQAVAEAKHDKLEERSALEEEKIEPEVEQTEENDESVQENLEVEDDEAEARDDDDDAQVEVIDNESSGDESNNNENEL